MTINPELLEFLKGFEEISAEQLPLIAETLPVETYKKKSVLLSEGEIPQACFFVLKGCVREYTTIEGVEKTTQIYTEKKGAISSRHFVNQTPSEFGLICLEDCVLLKGNDSINENNLQQFPVLNKIVSKMVETDLNETKAEFSVYITSTPQERYEHFLTSSPDLINRVPQHYIANLLGIKPESLSRIRKRIAEK